MDYAVTVFLALVLGFAIYMAKVVFSEDYQVQKSSFNQDSGRLEISEGSCEAVLKINLSVPTKCTIKCL